MNVFRDMDGLASVSGPLVVAAGVFDGMHPGHKAVLQAALDSADRVGGTAVALTFDPHPSKILRPENSARLLTSTRHKLHLMDKLRISAVLVIPFDKEFAAVEAEDFLRGLSSSAKKLARICVGQGWRFGHARRGDADLLRRIGPELGFETTEVEPVQIDGTTVSSTLIRQLVESGELEAAARFLGRNYSILGTVIPGDGLGKKLGFPTANLAAHNEQFPPDGVYAVRVHVGGELLRGVANIGSRPTVKTAGERLLEVHLLDFSGDLYGRDIEAEFLHFLRPEKKFPDVDALRGQIAIDVQSARLVAG
ncbi:MAG: bifunctional riboflavin kinase/FAD synthetase [Verrucomicrobia bacterium]|nr:bifunctional riboflavin kinase/FAD synthetase [Verrucomicrobiota bacterium]